MFKLKRYKHISSGAIAESNNYDKTYYVTLNNTSKGYWDPIFIENTQDWILIS